MPNYFHIDVTPLAQPLVITLVGAASIDIVQGSLWVDPGAIAIDAEDGDITDQIVVSGSVNVFVPGTYALTYNVTDSDDNSALPVQRVITVLSRVIPERPYGRTRKQSIFRQKNNQWSMVDGAK
jgi:hypothetical protein